MNTISRIVFALVLLLASAMPAMATAVDINHANATELAKGLNGVGLSKAEAIVAYRAEHGPFESADELTKVRGIGIKTVERNRDNIEIRSAKASARRAGAAQNK